MQQKKQINAKYRHNKHSRKSEQILGIGIADVKKKAENLNTSTANLEKVHKLGIKKSRHRHKPSTTDITKETRQ